MRHARITSCDSSMLWRVFTPASAAFCCARAATSSALFLTELARAELDIRTEMSKLVVALQQTLAALMGAPYPIDLLRRGIRRGELARQHLEDNPAGIKVVKILHRELGYSDPATRFSYDKSITFQNA